MGTRRDKIKRPDKRPDDPVFGARLREATKARGMEPGELARVLGIHGTTMSRWRGGKMPPEPQLRHLAGVLTVSLNWLKTGQGPREAAEATTPIKGAAYGPGGVARGGLDSGEPSIPRRVVREAYNRAWDAVADGARLGKAVPGEVVALAFGQFSADLSLSPPSVGLPAVPGQAGGAASDPRPRRRGQR